jgi:hypothetical protein
MPYHYQEYLALGEKICAYFPFKIYFTLKYGCWPKNVDEDSFKGTGNKLKRSEHKGQVEEHASNHVEDVCNSETTTSSTPLELSHETHGTSTYDGQVDNTHDATF